MRHPVLRRAQLVGVTILLAVPLAVGACSTVAATAPTIADAWVRSTPAGGDSAAYFTITNPGPSGDTLQSITTSGASMAELHQTSTDATGMTGMAGMDGLVVGPGSTVTLTPGGTHVMLMGVTHELAIGGSLELHLSFEHAGTITVIAAVRQD